MGGIRSYDVAKRLVDEGVADYLSMSRPLIRESGLIGRWKGEGVSCVPLEPQAAETFFPQSSEMVPASPPHPPGTGYKISIGLEEWESSYIPVIKIQMVCDGKILERSPSFPLGTMDHQNVSKAITGLLEKQMKR